MYGVSGFAVFFATGTTSKVNNKHRICPPIMVTAIEARCSEPGGHWEQSAQRRQICCVKNPVPEEHLYVSRRFSREVNFP
jgi:hypothetical protein